LISHIEIFNGNLSFKSVLSNIILKTAIILIITAAFIQAIRPSLDYRSVSLGIFHSPEITNALSIIQYLFVILGIFLIAKFIIDKVFNKK